MKDASLTPSDAPRHWRDRTATGAIGLALVLFALAGCVSDRALPEFKLYLSTYDEASKTVSTVLDEFEAAEFERARDHARRFGMTPLRWREVPADKRKEERQKGLDRIKRNGGFDDAFHIEDSVYHATSAVPPVTASFRRAYAAIGAYNAVLDAYAEGRALDELKAKIGGLASALGSLGDTLEIGSNLFSATVPGGSLVSRGLNIVDTALLAGSKEAFRNAVIDLEPEIDKTLAEMRDASPAMFDLLTAKRRNAVKDATSAEAKRKGIEAIEKYRVVMSNWVVALDATELALDRVVDAIEAPGTTLSLLSDLTATTANAAAVTEQTRRLIGEIRTGS